MREPGDPFGEGYASGAAHSGAARPKTVVVET
jgi:hypothetical protein